MILIPEHTDIYFDKFDVKLDERTLLKKTYGKDRIYYCACNKKVPYKLSKDNRFYPIDRNARHEKNCPESEEYKKAKKRMSAYREEENEDGTTTTKVRITDNLKNQKKNGEQFVGDDRACKQITNSLSLEAYLEVLFLSSYATMKKSTKKDKKDVYKIAYAKLCSTEAIYNGRKCLMKSNETPFKLFYGRLSGIKEFSKDTKNGPVKLYTLSMNEREVDVSQQDLQDAVDRFKAKYNCNLKIPPLCVIRRMKSKYKIEKAFFSDTEIFFFPVSEQGCICSSAFERDVINEIEKVEEDQNLWYFYKPYSYGYGAYGEDYLEDGLLVIRNNYKKICIEFGKGKAKRKKFIDDGKYKMFTFTEGEKFSPNRFIEAVKEFSI